MLLSICIPTYNRAKLLEYCLRSLMRQISEVENEVEIIISDNNSNDNTYEVIMAASKTCSIKYSKNKKNIGGSKNCIKLVEELAGGDYCWIIGDDEIIQNGALKIIVESIKNHVEIDYFYVNYSCHSIRKELLQVNSLDYNFEFCGNYNMKDSLIDHWEKLIEEDCNFLTPIYCSIFRRKKFLKYTKELKITEPLSNLDSTYPHTVVLTKMMFGKPAWRIGQPLVNVFENQSTWVDYASMVMFFRIPELFEYFILMGVDEKYINKHKKNTINSCVSIFINSFFRGKKFAGLNNWKIINFLVYKGRAKVFLKALVAAITEKFTRLYIKKPLI